MVGMLIKLLVKLKEHLKRHPIFYILTDSTIFIASEFYPMDQPTLLSRLLLYSFFISSLICITILIVITTTSPLDKDDKIDDLYWRARGTIIIISLISWKVKIIYEAIA